MDAVAAQALAPEGVRLWQRAGKTSFTVLTYQHGHFGPALAGRFRGCFPSPLQSNWRFYLDAGGENLPSPRTVFFLKNVMNSLPYVLGTRLFSDALPSHLAGRFVHRTDGREFESRIDPGQGSAPALACIAQRTEAQVRFRAVSERMI